MGLGCGGVLWLLVFSKERIQSPDAEIGVRLSLKVRTTWQVLLLDFKQVSVNIYLTGTIFLG